MSPKLPAAATISASSPRSLLDLADHVERGGDRERRLVVLGLGAERQVDDLGAVADRADDRAGDLDLAARPAGAQRAVHRDVGGRRDLRDDAAHERAVPGGEVEEAVGGSASSGSTLMSSACVAGSSGCRGIPVSHPSPRRRAVDAGVDDGDACAVAVAGRERGVVESNVADRSGTATPLNGFTTGAERGDVGQRGGEPAGPQLADGVLEVLGRRRLRGDQPDQPALEVRTAELGLDEPATLDVRAHAAVLPRTTSVTRISPGDHHRLQPVVLDEHREPGAAARFHRSWTAAFSRRRSPASRPALDQLVDLSLHALPYSRRDGSTAAAGPVVAPEGSPRDTGFVR